MRDEGVTWEGGGKWRGRNIEGGERIITWKWGEHCVETGMAIGKTAGTGREARGLRKKAEEGDLGDVGVREV